MTIFTTITTDVFNATNPAIQYIADDVQITIAPGISVVSGGSHGIRSTQNQSALINNGNIFGVLNGVAFSGNDATITNNVGRSIAGRIDGISLSNPAAGFTVTNHGTVVGYENVGISHTGGDIVVINDGTIYGQFAAFKLAGFDGGVLNNSGLIHSDSFGVHVETNFGLTTVIHNFAGGTIKGTDAAIFNQSAGRISLDNRGTIAGIIDLNANGGNVNDVVVNKGKITGPVFLGPGDDVFNGSGGSATKVFGEDGNDTLTGGKSNDTLDGGAGLDTVRGGRGKDQLFGGTERDIFDFNSIKESVKGSKRDVINDFVHGNNVTGDDIDLRTIDAKIGVGGNQAFKFIGKNDFHDKKGELRIEDKGAKVIVQGDVNGDGNADFEILVKVGTLSAGDFLL